MVKWERSKYGVHGADIYRLSLLDLLRLAFGYKIDAGSGIIIVFGKAEK